MAAHLDDRQQRKKSSTHPQYDDHYYGDLSNDSDDGLHVSGRQVTDKGRRKQAFKRSNGFSESIDCGHESDLSCNGFNDCSLESIDPSLMRECVNCSTQKTSQWRTNGSGHYLCNACGLYKKYNGEDRPPASVVVSRKKNCSAPKQCSNCGTLTSSMWRRTANKEVACNACGLYYKLYGKHRPIEMRKDVVYPRNRYSKHTLNGQTVNGSTDGHNPLLKSKKMKRKSKSRQLSLSESADNKPIDLKQSTTFTTQSSSLSLPPKQQLIAESIHQLSALKESQQMSDCFKQCAKCGANIFTQFGTYFGHYLCSNCDLLPKCFDSEDNTTLEITNGAKKKTRDIECSNCGVTKSSEWRRNPSGQPVCNACGLYFKLHMKNRPIHMRRDFIAHRKRTMTASDDYTCGQSSNAGNSDAISNQFDGNNSDTNLSQLIPMSSSKKRKQSNPKKLVIPENYI